jgi:hypothetical protein
VNEIQARRVLLVRAFETVDADRRLLTEDDRRYAAKVADEMTRWQSNERGRSPAPDDYLQTRAELLLTKLAERVPAVARLLKTQAWPMWIGTWLPALAFAIGIAADVVSDGKRISIIAFPLLGIMLWNIVSYAVMVFRASGRLASGATRVPHRFAQWMGGLRATQSLSTAKYPLEGGALEAFHTDWFERSGPLASLRIARIWHLCAAFLGAGALFGLYLRGLAFEYRAGWESTFLGPEGVRVLLNMFLAPFAALIRTPLPSVSEIAALQWSAGANGENAARWIHLYAVAMFTVVILPRLALAWTARMREERLIERFPLSLEEPYFRRILAGWGQGPVRLRVWPYSYTLDEAATRGLRAIARRVFGDTTELIMMPAVKFGGEDGFRPSQAPAAAGRTIDVLLFSITATPEAENHGRFVREARVMLPGAQVWIDDSPYKRRFGDDVAAMTRLAERTQAWVAFVAAHGAGAIVLDLAEPDLAALENTLHRG